MLAAVFSFSAFAFSLYLIYVFSCNNIHHCIKSNLKIGCGVLEEGGRFEDDSLGLVNRSNNGTGYDQKLSCEIEIFQISIKRIVNFE